MKKTIIVISILSLALWSCHSGNKNEKSADMQNHSAEDSANQQPASPHKMAMNNIGSNHVHIEYSAPSVRGRTIWGGLVPYDKVWVTGAHMATSIQFGNDLLIHGTKVPAGKYALFTIPEKETWTLIINKTWDQHQADNYAIKDDVLRFTVTPEVQSTSAEQLSFEVNPTVDKKGEIILKWEKLKIAFEVESNE